MGFDNPRREFMARRRLAQGKNAKGYHPDQKTKRSMPRGSGILRKTSILAVEETEDSSGRKSKVAVVGVASYGKATPEHAIANSISDALDPVKAPSKVQSLKDMSPEKRAEMERLYGSGPARKK